MFSVLDLLYTFQKNGKKNGMFTWRICTAFDLMPQGFQFPLKVEQEKKRRSNDWLPSSLPPSSAWFQIQLLGKVHRLALPRCNCTERKTVLLEEDKQHLVLERGIKHLDKHTGDRWKLHGDPVYIRGSDRLSDSIGLHPCHTLVLPHSSISVVASLKRIVCSAAGCCGGILSACLSSTARGQKVISGFMQTELLWVPGKFNLTVKTVFWDVSAPLPLAVAWANYCAVLVVGGGVTSLCDQVSGGWPAVAQFSFHSSRGKIVIQVWS